MMAETAPKQRYITPPTRFRQLCFKLVMSDTFDNFMIVIIISNVLVMCLTHYGQVGSTIRWPLP